MHIDKKQALRVIKEEVNKLLAEQPQPDQPPGWEELAALGKVTKKRRGLNVQQMLKKIKVKEEDLFSWKSKKELEARERRSRLTWTDKKYGVDPTTQKVTSGAVQRTSDIEKEQLKANETDDACAGLQAKLRPEGAFPVSASDPAYGDFLRRVTSAGPRGTHAGHLFTNLVGKKNLNPGPGAAQRLRNAVDATKGQFKFHGCEVKAAACPGEKTRRVDIGSGPQGPEVFCPAGQTACFEQISFHASTEVNYPRLVSKYGAIGPAFLMKACSEHDYYAKTLGPKFLVTVGDELLLAKKEVISTGGTGRYDPIAKLIQAVNSGLKDLTGITTEGSESDPMQIYGLYHLDFFVGFAVRWDFHNISILPYNSVGMGAKQPAGHDPKGLGWAKSKGSIEGKGYRAYNAGQGRNTEVSVGGGTKLPIFRVKLDKNGDPLLPTSQKPTDTESPAGCITHPCPGNEKCIGGKCYKEADNRADFRTDVDERSGIFSVVRYIHEILTSRPEENIHKILPYNEELLLQRIKDNRPTTYAPEEQSSGLLYAKPDAEIVTGILPWWKRSGAPQARPGREPERSPLEFRGSGDEMPNRE